jgi:hypothetical protein
VRTRRTCGAAGLLLILALFASACGGGGPEPRPASHTTVCRVDLQPPPEFHRAGRQRIPEPNRVAVRETYRSKEGQVLTLFSGLRGEFGEGMHFYGRIRRSNGTARLYGARSNWVLIWESAPPCGPRAVIGERFSRHDFREALQQMHLIPA